MSCLFLPVMKNRREHDTNLEEMSLIRSEVTLILLLAVWKIQLFASRVLRDIAQKGPCADMHPGAIDSFGLLASWGVKPICERKSVIKTTSQSALRYDTAWPQKVFRTPRTEQATSNTTPQLENKHFSFEFGELRYSCASVGYICAVVSISECRLNSFIET